MFKKKKKVSDEMVQSCPLCKGRGYWLSRAQRQRIEAHLRQEVTKEDKQDNDPAKRRRPIIRVRCVPCGGTGKISQEYLRSLLAHSPSPAELAASITDRDFGD